MAAGHAHAVDAQLVADDGHGRPVAHEVQDLRAHAVEHGHAGGGQQEGAGVRVPPGDARGGVDHRHDAGGDQALGGDGVEVLVVDDGDLTRDDALGQVLGATAHPGDAPDGRPPLGREGWVDVGLRVPLALLSHLNHSSRLP
jgi:hypothetical protein